MPALANDTVSAGKLAEAEMQKVLDKQKAAHLASLPVTADIRIDRLDRAIDILLTHQNRLIEAMAEDFGMRSASMSRFSDILVGLSGLQFSRKYVRKWMRSERHPLEFPLGLLGARGWVEYQPKGIVGIISPWNFPVNLTFAPLAGVFAAGNRAMIKPSEYTPITSSVMQELFSQAYDEDEVAVFTGGPEVGQAFSTLAFDHLIFTGATSVGRHVMRAAADHLVPLTLELGGKSPVFVGKNANIDRAADRIVIGKMMNAGQVCLAPDYILVDRSQEEPLAQAIAGKAAMMYPELIDSPDYTAIINDRHFERLQDVVQDARDKGADVHVVNPSGEDLKSANKRIMPLTLIRNVRDDMKVMQDEIFGPVLPIKSYTSFNDAVDYVNRGPRPLASYYFGDDKGEERKMLDKVTSGGATLEDVAFHMAQESMPFGGVGASGMGAYHGYEGFRAVSHAKAVYRQTRFDLMKLLGARPPYGKALERTLAFKLKK